MAWAAARRGDWRAVRRRTERGSWRGVWLLRRLAGAHLGTGTPGATLWWFWALAPGRWRSYRAVREALDRCRAGGRTGEPRGAGVAADGKAEPLGMRHLRLLAMAAAGEPPERSEIEALALGWERAFEGHARAHLLARGLELGVHDLQGAVVRLRSSLLAELEALAEVAQGNWNRRPEPGSLLAALRRRELDALHERVHEEVLHFGTGNGLDRPVAAPLVELERWLHFRATLQHLVRAAGHDALATAWYNGVRIAACNWPVYVQRTHGERGRWICYEMYVWCERMASEWATRRSVASRATTPRGWPEGEKTKCVFKPHSPESPSLSLPVPPRVRIVAVPTRC